MVGFRGHHKLPWLHRQQIVVPHHPQHPLMIHRQSSRLQLPRHSPVAIATPMFYHHLLHRRTHQHLFSLRLLFRQAAVVACSTHAADVTHPFHTQSALHRHHFPDLVVDAFAPSFALPWRRASILCKAPCKKSTSSTFSASTCFSRVTSCRSPASRSRAGSAT